MRVATNPGAIKHLVERGMADAISAEFDRKQGIIDGLVEENARLQAEVERLTERNQHLEQIDSYLQSANLNAEEQRNIELEAEVERLTKENALSTPRHLISSQDIKSLKAEVARLRKAGAVMGGFLPDTDEANAAYADFEKGGQS